MNIYNVLLLMMAFICSFSAVTVCHQAPDACYFLLIRIAALVCKKLSMALCNKLNDTKLLPKKPG